MTIKPIEYVKAALAAPAYAKAMIQSLNEIELKELRNELKARYSIECRILQRQIEGKEFPCCHWEY